MQKKRIGIPGWNISENTFGCTKPYLEYVAKFGIPVILTPQMDEVQDIDLLFLPGGADVNPVRYKQTPSFYTGQPNVMLEWFDTKMLPKYIDNNTPIVACCRGLQTTVVHFGGTLTQHLFGQHTQSSHNEDECHQLAFVPQYQDLAKLIPNGTNSRHHQCADPKTLPDVLEIVAYATETRYQKTKAGKEYFEEIQLHIPEIIKHKEKDIFLFQGHLEDLHNQELGAHFINKFLNK